MASKENEQQESNFPEKLAAPARRALNGAGYTRLEQLAKVSEADIMKLHGMGPKALEQLRQALSVQGLDFAAGKK
jgi:predicted flap endonuclease-1-like 5' DNA nuclease